MAGIGKKILGAFVEMKDDEEEKEKVESQPDFVQPSQGPAPEMTASEKFKNYFDRLFTDSNAPGPDYFEFSKMVEAMAAIPDERTKFVTAFAGLSIQGLDKKKLLATTDHYLQILDSDAKNFSATVTRTLNEKVTAKKKEMEDKTRRIQELNNEIAELSKKLEVISTEVKENEEKINANAASYQAELQQMRNRISEDRQKINQYIS